LFVKSESEGTKIYVDTTDDLLINLAHSFLKTKFYIQSLLSRKEYLSFCEIMCVEV